MRRAILVLFSASILLCALAAQAQDDAPSLGDAARQARAQKQQKDSQAAKDAQAAAPAKDAQSPASTGKDAQAADTGAQDAQLHKPPKRVITNDEIPEHIGPTSTLKPGTQPVAPYPQPSTNQMAADQWKQQILSMKSYLVSMQTQIASLENSIHYTGANCVSGCVQWNERQEQRQQQVEIMKQQLVQQKRSLEQMQETARRQGYGSSVWDP